MAELVQTSSMTSVTEEDSSADSESDTTESSYSNVTSSVLSSTDTDDKLTPGLTNISISKTASASRSPIKKRKQSCEDVKGVERTQASSSNNNIVSEPDVNSQSGTKEGAHQTVNGSISDTTATVSNTPGTNFVYPYGANPLPLECAGPDVRHRGRNTKPHPSLLNTCNKTYLDAVQNCSRNFITGCKENLGVDDTDNRLSTDFSDTSSIQVRGDQSNNNEFEVESNEEEDKANLEGSEPVRPFHPDWTSRSWYRAQCFDRYWTHYNFVMEWYQAHVQAVRTLQGHVAGPWTFPPAGRSCQGSQISRSERSRRKKRSRRAKSRRSAKARQRAKEKGEGSVSISATDTEDVSPASTSALSATRSGRQSNRMDGRDDGEELEMEITDEMLEFFTTSFKHRMERDGAKNESNGADENSRLNIEEARVGQQGPSSTAPSERPGVRRTAEMRELYGAGAPMIHGMETALQMTFDRISDRFQPKPWPNMPLKIVFA